MRATVPMVARKGRASYLGDRSWPPGPGCDIGRNRRRRPPARRQRQRDDGGRLPRPPGSSRRPRSAPPEPVSTATMGPAGDAGLRVGTRRATGWRSSSPRSTAGRRACDPTGHDADADIVRLNRMMDERPRPAVCSSRVAVATERLGATAIAEAAAPRSRPRRTSDDRRSPRAPPTCARSRGGPPSSRTQRRRTAGRRRSSSPTTWAPSEVASWSGTSPARARTERRDRARGDRRPLARDAARHRRGASRR